jgi:hypothetical protein
MPKSIVPSPTAAVAVDRLTLQATDARATDHGAAHVTPSLGETKCVCFSEE